jgi:hypothetical protein
VLVVYEILGQPRVVARVLLLSVFGGGVDLGLTRDEARERPGPFERRELRAAQRRLGRHGERDERRARSAVEDDARALRVHLNVVVPPVVPGGEALARREDEAAHHAQPRLAQYAGRASFEEREVRERAYRADGRALSDATLKKV